MCCIGNSSMKIKPFCFEFCQHANVLMLGPTVHNEENSSIARQVSPIWVEFNNEIHHKKGELLCIHPYCCSIAVPHSDPILCQFIISTGEETFNVRNTFNKRNLFVLIFRLGFQLNIGVLLL